MNKGLKYCPFCGSKNIMIDTTLHPLADGWFYKTKFVKCEKCGARSAEKICDGYDGKTCSDEEIAELWNMRSWKLHASKEETTSTTQKGRFGETTPAEMDVKDVRNVLNKLAEYEELEEKREEQIKEKNSEKYIMQARVKMEKAWMRGYRKIKWRLTEKIRES